MGRGISRLILALTPLRGSLPAPAGTDGSKGAVDIESTTGALKVKDGSRDWILDLAQTWLV